jgi:hypothetical protein
MIREHVDEAVTLIGALNGPGVSKLTMASAYHKLASSFLSSVSSASLSPCSSASLLLGLCLSLSLPCSLCLTLLLSINAALSLCL